MRLSPALGTALIWAFWLVGPETGRDRSGWTVAPTQHACEAGRALVIEMLAAGGRLHVSRCHQMTVEELEERRHRPPSDTGPFILGH